MNSPDDTRTRLLYTSAEAARLAGTAPATVTRWFCGRDGEPPLFTDRRRPADERFHLSFLELVELIVAHRFRKHGISVEQLRQSREFALKHWQVEYPFAERRVKLLGGRVFDPDGIAIDLEWPATQPALPKFAELATQVFDYEELGDDAAAAWAQRFFPAGDNAPLMIDPRFAGGSVTFLNRGLLLETVVKRWLAKESIAFIASDFDLKESDVEAALRYAHAA